MFRSSGVGGKGGNIRPYQQQQNQPQPINQSLQQLQHQSTQQTNLQQPPPQHSQQQTQRHHSHQSQQNQHCQQSQQNYSFQQSQSTLNSQQNLLQQQHQQLHLDSEQQLHHLQQEQQIQQQSHQLFQQLSQTQISVLPTSQDLLTSQNHQQQNVISQLYSQNIPPSYVQFSTYIPRPTTATNGQIYATTTSIPPPPSQQQQPPSQPHGTNPPQPPQIPGQPFYFPTTPGSVPFQATPSFYYVPTASFSHPPPLPQYATHLACNLNLPTNSNIMMPAHPNICVPSQSSLRDNRQKIREHALAVIDPMTKRNILDDIRFNAGIDSDTSSEKAVTKLSNENIQPLKELCDQQLESIDGTKPLAENEINLKVDQQMQTDSINHDKEKTLSNENFMTTFVKNWNQKSLSEEIQEIVVPNINFKSKYWRFRSQAGATSNTENDSDEIYFGDLYNYRTKRSNLKKGKSISSQSIDNKVKTRFSSSLGSYDNLWMNSSMEPMPQRIRFQVKNQDSPQNTLNEKIQRCSSNIAIKASDSETDISNLSKEFRKQSLLNFNSRNSSISQNSKQNEDTKSIITKENSITQAVKKTEISYENVSVTCHPNNIIETIVESSKVRTFESSTNIKKVEEVKIKIFTKHDEKKRSPSPLSLSLSSKKPIKKVDQSTNASNSNPNEQVKKKKTNKNKRKFKTNKYPPSKSNYYTDDQKYYDGIDSSSNQKRNAAGEHDKNTNTMPTTGKKKNKNIFKTEQLTLDTKKTEFVNINNELSKTNNDKTSKDVDDDDSTSNNGATNKLCNNMHPARSGA